MIVRGGGGGGESKCKALYELEADLSAQMHPPGLDTSESEYQYV